MVVLITLRHPGPLQAIAAMLPTLKDASINVVLICTDSALECAQNRLEKQIEGLMVYYFRGCWIKSIITSKNRLTQSGLTEFKRVEEKGFVHMVNDMKFILQKEEPDVILRTTPAMNYGVDEAVSRAASELEMMDRMRCYQEIYDCGMDLGEMKNPVAVVDRKAAERLKRHGIDSFVVGWMNRAIFEAYDPYGLVRAWTRAKLGLNDMDQAILYCTVASGNNEAEFTHFRHFLEQVSSVNVRAYIRFHPRNSDGYRHDFLKMVKAISTEIEVVDCLSVEQSLAFPDYVISAGSAMNLDVLQYQIVSGIATLNTLSIYIKDKETKAILYTALGVQTQPYMEEGMGSLILDGDGYLTRVANVSEKERRQLYDEANEMFGLPSAKVKERFLIYLLNKTELVQHLYGRGK